MNRTRNFVIVFITLLLAGGVYAWFYPLNTGHLVIQSNVEGFSLKAGEKALNCQGFGCQIKLRTGAHLISVEKENYYDQSLNLFIKRGETQNLNLSLEKIPRLVVSPIIPESKTSKPTPNQVDPTFSKQWNKAQTKLVYLDSIDNRLKIWGDGQIENIAQLKGISNIFELHWSENEELLAGLELQDLYWISIEDKTRIKHQLSFVPKTVQWASGETLLIADSQNKLFELDSKGKLNDLGQTVDLKEGKWSAKNTLVFYEPEDGLINYDPTKNSTQTLLKPTFEPAEIQNDEEGNIYILNSEENNWYVLDF